MDNNSFDLRGFLSSPVAQANKPAAMKYLQSKGIVDQQGLPIKKTPTPAVSNNSGLPSTSDSGTQGGRDGYNPVTDISGYDTRKAGGVLSSILQNTIGSRGLAGVAQLPGKVIADAIASKDVKKFSDNATEIYNHATDLLKLAKTEADPTKQNSLRKQADALIQGAHVLMDHVNEIGKFNLTAKEALGTSAQAALTVATGGGSSLAESIGLTGFKALGARVAEGAATGAAFQASSNLADNQDVGKDVGKATLIGGAIPVLGTVLSKGKEIFGKLLQTGGEKVQMSIIKPSLADVRDGFDIKNINKYDLGGDLATTLSKTTQKMNTLTTELRSKISASDKTININDLINQTEQELSKNKLSNFGDNGKIKNIIQGLRDETDSVLHSPDVNIADAQILKQAVGLKGAWQYGNTAPDAKASETVYNALYSKIKTAIENSSPAGVKEINKQLSELIPINHAVIRRIPIEARNNALSLTDTMGLIASAIDPKAVGVTLLNRALKSGSIGKAATKAGMKLQKPSTFGGSLGRKVFGR